VIPVCRVALLFSSQATETPRLLGFLFSLDLIERVAFARHAVTEGI